VLDIRVVLTYLSRVGIQLAELQWNTGIKRIKQKCLWHFAMRSLSLSHYKIYSMLLTADGFLHWCNPCSCDIITTTLLIIPEDCWQFGTVVASFVTWMKLLYVEPGIGGHIFVVIPSAWSILGQLSLASLRGSLNWVPALIGRGKGGKVTSAGWQLTLRDPVWHVSSRSGDTSC